MINLDLQELRFQKAQMVNKVDPSQYPEIEDWELTFAKIKDSILESRCLMFKLEREIREAKKLEYKNGFKNGMLPVPF